MGSYKLIALDMDGTLLDGEQRISPGNLSAIRDAQRAGVTVVLATGRGIQSVKPYVLDYGLELPLVTANGAEVWRTHETLHRRTLMPPETVDSLRRIAVACDAWYWGYAVSGLYNKEGWPARADREAWLKFGYYMEDQAALSGIVRQIEPWGLEITNSDTRNIEVNTLGVSKAAGLREICSWIGIGMGEVVAMGDSLNDLAMIREAGFGVAMGNAQEAVKAAADAVTSAHTEDGVARIIREVVLAL